MEIVILIVGLLVLGFFTYKLFFGKSKKVTGNGGGSIIVPKEDDPNEGVPEDK